MSATAPPPDARVPDFFLVGHQKCGTTALYLMLKQHPQIYMPDAKEPRYFASDLRSRFGARSKKGRPLTLDGYLSLFAPAREEQLAGEASPQYLRSRVAAKGIWELQPNARIIAILREPASFLRSLHMQMVASQVETQTDLGKAIALEPARRAGKRIPRRSRTPQTLLYSDHVRYVEQLGRYRALFGSERVLVLIYEEFRSQNEATVRQVLRFLGVDDTVPIDVVQTTPQKAVRSTRLHNMRHAVQVARRNPAAAGRVSRALSAVAPGPGRASALARSFRRVAYAPARPPDEAVMLELRRRFKGEVHALSEYLGRDLVSFWGYDQLG